jgi:hypothetical protein
VRRPRSNAARYADETDDRQRQLTPAYILEPIRKDLGSIELDPCTEPDNPTGASRFYCPPADGLALPWDAETIFVNPPYGRAKDRWIARCTEAGRAGSSVVLLIPAATDITSWQQAGRSAGAVVLVEGRIRFGRLRPNRREETASHPSSLFFWNVDPIASAQLGLWLTKGDD